MTTNYFKPGRFVPWLGIALVAGAVVAVATYVNVEGKTRASDPSAATLERLIHDQHLCAALKKIHDGEVAEATERLDLLLCGDILLINAELPSTDPETRALVQRALQRIAKTRPKTETADPDPLREHVVDRLAAERVLALALATEGVASSR